MTILGTFLFGLRHYANWPTAISCGVVVGIMLLIVLVAAIAGRKTRSSESSTGHTE